MPNKKKTFKKCLEIIKFANALVTPNLIIILSLKKIFLLEKKELVIVLENFKRKTGSKNPKKWKIVNLSKYK